MADAVAEADSDDLSVGVAVVTRAHADAVRDASTIRERLAGPDVNRMRSGSVRPVPGAPLCNR